MGKRFLVTVLLGVFLALPLRVTVQAQTGASGKPKLAIAPFRINELHMTVEDSDVRDLHERVELEIREFGEVELIDPEKSRVWAWTSGMPEGDGCFSLDCMLNLGRALDADLVLGLVVGGEKRSSEIQYEVRLVDVSARQVTQQEFGSSREPYGLPGRELRRSVEWVLRRQLSPKATLVINTVPPESAVLLNDQATGFAPLELTLPSGMVDTLTVVRQGYVTKHQTIELKPNERREITIELERDVNEPLREFPPLHLYAIVGNPLDQASSNLDSRISWGEGQSFGFRLDAGSVWRIALGFLMYDGRLDDVDPLVMDQVGAVKDPSVFATAVHSNLFYYPGSESFSPYLGLGVAALQRNITQHYDDSSEERKTEFEAAWLFMLGLEAKIYGPVQANIELLHARTLLTSDAWSQEEDSDMERALWERSFSDFESFTVLRLGVGYTF